MVTTLLSIRALVWAYLGWLPTYLGIKGHGGCLTSALYIFRIRYFCTQRDPVIANAMSRALNAIGR